MVKITHKSSLVFIYLFVHTDGIPPVPEADGVDDRELGKMPHQYGEILAIK